MPAWNEAQASEIIGRHSAREGALLPILHDVQAAFGCVPGEAVPFIAEALNLTADRLSSLNLVDEVIREPLGGAHRDPQAMARSLGEALQRTLTELKAVPADQLLERRDRSSSR